MTKEVQTHKVFLVQLNSSHTDIKGIGSLYISTKNSN